MAGLLLSACGNSKNNKDESKSSQSNLTSTIISSSSTESSSTVENTQSSTSTSEEELQKPSSDNGNRDIDSKDPVVIARQKLYEAGINSSGISNEELKKYIDDANDKKIDIVKYIEENVINK